MSIAGSQIIVALIETAPPIWLDQVPYQVLTLGSVMLVVITLIHGVGLDWIVGRFKRRSQKLRERRRSPHLASLAFSFAILLMLFLHIMELAIWGLVMNLVGLIPNLRDSVYFSANTYTTIGYGFNILPQSWRELAPLMAISGLFTFAWTTGEMFGIVGQQRELVAELSQQRRTKTKTKSGYRADSPTGGVQQPGEKADNG